MSRVNVKNLVLRMQDGSAAEAAEEGTLELIADDSGDTPALKVVDPEGNVHDVGGSGLPAYGDSVGNFAETDVGRIMQVQPCDGGAAFRLVWTGYTLPVLNPTAGDVEGDGNGADPIDEYPTGVVALSFMGGGEAGAPRLDWRAMFDPESTWLPATSAVDSAMSVDRSLKEASDVSLHTRLSELSKAAYSPFSEIAPASLGEPLSTGDVVTSRNDAGIHKYFKADNVAGHDAVGVVVYIDGDGYGLVYKGRGVMFSLGYTGTAPADGDHLYMSDTTPGLLMAGPPASGTKQYIGRARGDCASGIVYEMDLNIQPQQAV